MNDLENKYNAIKAKLKPYRTCTFISAILILVGLALSIVYFVSKNKITEILNYVALGIFGFVLIFLLILYLTYKKDLKELKKVKEEMIIEKRKK